jgi:hypothetical protein
MKIKRETEKLSDPAHHRSVAYEIFAKEKKRGNQTPMV